MPDVIYFLNIFSLSYSSFKTFPWRPGHQENAIFRCLAHRQNNFRLFPIVHKRSKVIALAFKATLYQTTVEI